MNRSFNAQKRDGKWTTVAETDDILKAYLPKPGQVGQEPNQRKFGKFQLPVENFKILKLCEGRSTPNANF